MTYFSTSNFVFLLNNDYEIEFIILDEFYLFREIIYEEIIFKIIAWHMFSLF